MKEVILKIKTKDNWAGVVKYRNCFENIGPCITRTGNVYTGLSREDAVRLEKAMRYPEGHLAPDSSFWHTYNIKVGTQEVIIRPEDPNEPSEELKYLFLKNHPLVQYGLKDIKPRATCVLIDREAEAERENRILKVGREANREFDKMTLEDMRKCLRLYGQRPDSLSNELVENKLYKLVQDDPKRFLEKWTYNKHKATEFLLETAISKNVIRRNKNIYTYGTDIIGHSLEDTINWLDDKRNQDIRIAIMEETDKKD